MRSGFLAKGGLGNVFAKGQAKQTPTMNGRKMSSPREIRKAKTMKEKKGKLSL